MTFAVVYAILLSKLIAVFALRYSFSMESIYLLLKTINVFSSGKSTPMERSIYRLFLLFYLLKTLDKIVKRQYNYFSNTRLRYPHLQIRFAGLRELLNSVASRVLFFYALYVVFFIKKLLTFAVVYAILLSKQTTEPLIDLEYWSPMLAVKFAFFISIAKCIKKV